MHGCAAFPLTLAKALSERHGELEGVEINHLHTEPVNPLSQISAQLQKQQTPGSPNSRSPPFRVVNYFVGPHERKFVADGVSDLVPCFLSDLPNLMRLGYRKPDIAMVQVSPPDRHGFCSLGIEVCTAYAACETSPIIIAQINRNMPRTHGQSFIHYNCLDYVVEEHVPLPSLPVPSLSNHQHDGTGAGADDVNRRIGKIVADLVPDGACLQESMRIK